MNDQIEGVPAGKKRIQAEVGRFDVERDSERHDEHRLEHCWLPAQEPIQKPDQYNAPQDENRRCLEQDHENVRSKLLGLTSSEPGNSSRMSK